MFFIFHREVYNYLEQWALPHCFLNKLCCIKSSFLPKCYFEKWNASTLMRSPFLQPSTKSLGYTKDAWRVFYCLPSMTFLGGYFKKPKGTNSSIIFADYSSLKAGEFNLEVKLQKVVQKRIRARYCNQDHCNPAQYCGCKYAVPMT